LAANAKIKIPVLTWAWLINELRRRGGGQRESGAFLLGRADVKGRRIVRFECYDDLDFHALTNGMITFHAQGYSALWEICRSENLTVLADVHTHPAGDTRQSLIDANNPMLAIPGHVGMIVPHYAMTSRWSLSGVGIHALIGGGKWKSYAASHPDCPVGLSLW
jgi:proteasome lid subunit RPN8/RPN11